MFSAKNNVVVDSYGDDFAICDDSNKAAIVYGMINAANRLNAKRKYTASSRIWSQIEAMDGVKFCNPIE